VVPAPNRSYELSEKRARAIIDDAIEAIVTSWHEAADRARLPMPQETAGEVAATALLAPPRERP
jgi:hypothetical protein